MNRLCRGRRMRRAFMIFCGLGKGCGLSRVLHDRRRRRLRLPFRRGGGGAVSPSFFGPAERRGRSSDFSVADGEGRPSPASCRSRSLWGLHCGKRRREWGVMHVMQAARWEEGGATCPLRAGFSEGPAACNLFRRSAFLRCSGGGSDGATSCPVDRADARVYPREK